MRFLSDLDLPGRRVLLRLDLNVPLDKMGGVADDSRIRGALQTIRTISAAGGRAILMSHLGRPKGKPDPSLSLRPIAERMTELLGRPVVLAPGIVGPGVVEAVESMKDGDCLLLENLRFHPGEKAGAEEFVRELASLGDLYVNDAFGTCHRDDASVAGLPAMLPAAAGHLVRKELESLGRALDDPKRPFVVILGGAKISDKIPVITHLLPLADRLLIGGAMAFTFLAARGEEVGQSMVDRERLDLARSLLEDGGDKILLPQDHILREDDGEARTSSGIPPGGTACDIGPATQEAYLEALKPARTVVWNGPMGIFEEKPFAGGTRAIAEAIAGLDHALTLAGGGETVAAAKRMGTAVSYSLVSTGGGAFLEFLAGKSLPGVEALERSARG